MRLTSCLVLSIYSVLTVSVIRAEVSIGPQVIVTGTTIEVLEPGPDLQEIIDSIDDEAADKPHLIKLGPGVYTIEADITTSEGIVMTPHISIMGSGRDVSILTGSISSGVPLSTSAIVTGASDAKLTDLSVENTGTGTFSIAIFGTNASLDISNVLARATEGAINVAMYLDGSGTTKVHNSSFSCSGGSNVNVGIDASAQLSVFSSEVEAMGGNSAYGILNNEGSIILDNVTVIASGGTTLSRGLQNSMGEAVITGSTIRGLTGGENSGVYNDGLTGSYTVEIRDSEIEGDWRSVRMFNSYTLLSSNTKFVGPVGTLGTKVCLNAFDSNFASLDANCQVPSP